MGQVLALTGFISGTTGSAYIAQPESALWALRIFVGVVPAIMLFFSIIVAWRYPLDKESYQEIQRQLAQKRAERV